MYVVYTYVPVRVKLKPLRCAIGIARRSWRLLRDKHQAAQKKERGESSRHGSRIARTIFKVQLKLTGNDLPLSVPIEPCMRSTMDAYSLRLAQ